MFKNKDHLTLDEIINYDHYKNITDGSISYYDVVHKQETNNLIRFPGITKALQEGWTIDYNSAHKFFRLKERGSGSSLTFDEVLKLVYNDFAYNMNIAVNFSCRFIEVVNTPMYIDEPFEQYRIRMKFQIRDYLGMPHHGYGLETIDGNKHYNPGLFKTVERVKENHNADLFAGVEFNGSSN